MNTGFADAIRLAVIGAAYLALVVTGLYACRRVAVWVRGLAPAGERRFARGALGFLVIHGLTLTLGGFAFLLFRFGLDDRLPATDRAYFLGSAATCFAVGPALAVVAWASLRRVCRTPTPA